MIQDAIMIKPIKLLRIIIPLFFILLNVIIEAEEGQYPLSEINKLDLQKA